VGTMYGDSGDDEKVDHSYGCDEKSVKDVDGLKQKVDSRHCQICTLYRSCSI